MCRKTGDFEAPAGRPAAAASDDFPRPRITRFAIFAAGGFVFALARIWPPLVLLVTAILSVVIPYSFRENDDGESRRRLWAEFLKREDLPKELRCMEVDMEERLWTNDRGMALMTSTMAPKHGAPVRAVVCFCHGYMDSASFVKRIQYQRFVKRGIAVVAIEYEGHGRSDGPNALIPCWENMVGDAHKYFSYITREKFPGTKKFLMGESMGGAVAFDIMAQNRSTYEGVILAAPMVRILAQPPEWIVDIFCKIAGDPGTVTPLSFLPIAPSRVDNPERSFKDPEKMRLALSAPTKYGRKPRLATARELLNATKRISASIGRFDAPFLVLHGLDDMITCPRVSEMLYNESPSEDKRIRLYRGMYHNLTGGETDRNIDVVFDDAIAWIVERS